jgi:hypothetical protein
MAAYCGLRIGRYTSLLHIFLNADWLSLDLWYEALSKIATTFVFL